MACIFSELPKAGACSPLLLLLQGCGMDQLGIQSMRKRLHRAHSMCSLTEGHQLKNSDMKEQWVMVEWKPEVKDAEMLQLSNKPKYL